MLSEYHRVPPLVACNTPALSVTFFQLWTNRGLYQLSWKIANQFEICHNILQTKAYHGVIPYARAHYDAGWRLPAVMSSFISDWNENNLGWWCNLIGNLLRETSASSHTGFCTKWCDNPNKHAAKAIKKFIKAYHQIILSGTIPSVNRNWCHYSSLLERISKLCG